jgi:hypothetical protein
MSDFGFSAKNDSGEYLITENTETLTFVKVAINIDTVIVGVNSPTQGRKDGFGGFSELIYKITNCAGTPVPFFTTPRNDKVYSVNRIRHAGGNEWYVHVITNARPYHKGNYVFTGNTTLPATGGFSSVGLVDAKSLAHTLFYGNNGGQFNLRTTNIQTTNVGAVYVVPRNFTSTNQAKGLDRGGYVVCTDKSVAIIDSSSGLVTPSSYVPFVQQETRPSQRIKFQNLIQAGKEVGYSIPVAGGANNNDKIFTDTGIFSCFQYNPGDLSHRGGTHTGSNTTGVPANGWKWERLGAVKYNFRGIDRTTRSGSPYATTETVSNISNFENSIEYWAGTVALTGGVDNFSGPDSNRSAGVYTITNATTNGGANVVVGPIQVTVATGGVVTEVVFQQGLNRNHAVGDTITVAGSLGGGTNFTFDIAAINNRTRIFVTEYGYQNILVGQYCMYGSLTTWREVVEKHSLPEELFVDNGETYEVESKYIAIDGNYVLEGYTAAQIAELGSHNPSFIGNLDDPIGTSNGNRKYNEENWMPGGEASLFTGIYVRGFVSSLSLSLGTNEGGSYTSASSESNMDFIPLSVYSGVAVNFYDFGTDPVDSSESDNPFNSIAYSRLSNYTTYHDAVFGAPETSRSFQPNTRLTTPTLNIDPDAPTSSLHTTRTHTYKAAPYYNVETHAGVGQFAVSNLIRNTAVSFKMPCMYYRSVPTGLGFLATKLNEEVVLKGLSSYHRFHTNSTASSTPNSENSMLWGGRTPLVNRTLPDGTEVGNRTSNAFTSPPAYPFVDVQSVSSVDFTPRNYTQIAPFEVSYSVRQELHAANDKVRSIGIHSNSFLDDSDAAFVDGSRSNPCLMTNAADPEDNLLIMLDNPHHTIKSGPGGDSYANSGPVLMVADLACSSALALARADTGGFYGTPEHYGPQHFHFMRYNQVATSSMQPGDYKIQSISSQHIFGNQYHEITPGSVSNCTPTTNATWNTPGSGLTRSFANPLDALNTARANSEDDLIESSSSSGFSSATMPFVTDPGLTNTNIGVILPDYSNLIKNSQANDYAIVAIQVVGKSWYGEDFSKTVLHRIYPSQSWTDGYNNTQYEDVKLYINKGEYAYASDYVHHYLGALAATGHTPNNEYFAKKLNYAVVPLSEPLEFQGSNNLQNSTRRHPHMKVGDSGNSGIPKDYVHCYKMADYNLTQRRFTHRLNTPLFSHKYVDNYFIFKTQNAVAEFSSRGGAHGFYFKSTEGQKLVDHGFGKGRYTSNANGMSTFKSRYPSDYLERFFDPTATNFYFDSNFRGGGYSTPTVLFDDGNYFGMLGCMDIEPTDHTLHHNNMRPLATICAMDYFGADSSTNKCTFTFYEKLGTFGNWVQKQDGELPYYNIFVHNPYSIDGTDDEAEDFVEGKAQRHFRVDVHRKAGFPTAKTNSARAYCTLDMTGYPMKTVYLRKFHITSTGTGGASDYNNWVHTGFLTTPDTVQTAYRSFIPGVKTAFGSIDNIHGFNAQPYYIAESTESTDSNWVTSSNAPTSLSDRTWRTTRNQALFTSPSTTPGSSVVEKSFGYFPITVGEGKNPNTNNAFSSAFLQDTGSNDSVTTIYQSWTDSSLNPFGAATRTNVSNSLLWKIRGITPENDNAEFLQDILTGQERAFVRSTGGFLDREGTFSECIVWDGTIVVTNASIYNNQDNSLPNPSTVNSFSYTYDTTVESLIGDIEYSGVKATGPFLEDDDGVEVVSDSNSFDATNIPRLYIFADPATAPTPHAADTSAVQILQADGTTVAFDSRHRQLQLHDIASASFPSKAFTRGVGGLKADSGGSKWQNHSSKFYPDQYRTVSGFTTPTNGAYFFNTKIQRSEVRVFSKTEKKTWNKYYHQTRYWANYKAGVQRTATDTFKSGFITVLNGHRYDVAKSRIAFGVGDFKLGGGGRKSGGIQNYENASYNSTAETIMSINTDLYTSNSYLVHIRKNSSTTISLDGEDRDGNIDHTVPIFNDDSLANGLQGPSLRFITGDEVVLGRHTGMVADFGGAALSGGFELYDIGVSWNDARFTEGQPNVPRDTCIGRVNSSLGSNVVNSIWIPDRPGLYWLKLRVSGFTEYVVPITVEQG